MNASNRIIANTASQYIRTIFNVILSLWSSRLILVALGESDFGIYSLVAGIVSMLSFIVNALTKSTQRYVSFYQGRNNIDDVRHIFNNSLILHLVIGAILIVVFEMLGIFLFDGFLNIPAERLGAAKTIYHFVVLMLLASIMSAPFKALLISHENIVYISVIEMFDGILKLVLAIVLAYIGYDKLVVYGVLMLAIQCVNLFAFAFFDFRKYQECRLTGFRSFDVKYLKEIVSFTGWIIYHSMCVVGRTQGVAVVLNKFYGTVVNAAYGIGMQVSGAINFVSSSLSNAINPQLVKSEGADNREHVWTLARLQCKYSFLLLATVSIPIIFEMDAILKVWLKDVPEYAGFFASMILVAALVNQLTDGLGDAKHAIGNIKKYVLIISTPKLLVIPAFILCLHYGASLHSLALCFIGAEAVSSLIRLPLLRHTDKLDVVKYIKEVPYKCIVPLFSIIAVCYVMVSNVNIPFRFLLTLTLSGITVMLSAYCFAMGSAERSKVNNVLKSVFRHFKRLVCRK